MTPHGRHILVIHPGALGDVLQSVPALRALGLTGRVIFAGQPRLGALLRGAGLVADAVSFDTLGLEALFTREEVPPPLARRLGAFARVVSWFGARDAVYSSRLRELVLDLVIAPPVPDAPAPVWRHLLASIAGREPPPEDLSPLLLPAEWLRRAQEAVAALGAAPGRPLLVVHPGAGSQWKRQPAELLARAVELALSRGEGEILVHEGPADHEAAHELLARLDRPARRLVEPDLALLAGVLARARAYLGADSGVSHLAAAVGAPAVILYPEATRERWRPWSPTALTLDAEGQRADAIARALEERLEN
jgi:ADP-heptose:LPS heptosyltransferase